MYLIRSLKYFAALCVLCMAAVALNLEFELSPLTLDEYLYIMLHTPRGLLLPTVLVVLAAFYPRFGFTVRTVEGDMTRHREQIVNAFKSARFSLRSEHDGVMTFRADGLLHKLMLLGEDEIKVSQQGDRIVLDGIRRGVARVVYRLEIYIQTVGND